MVIYAKKRTNSNKGLYVPVKAEFNIVHEREGTEEEIEFQIKWKNE
jgi:hypothetical protein